MITITQEHIDLAKRLGACKVRYRVGQPIEEVATNDLAWMEARAPELAKQLSAQLCEERGLETRAHIALSLFGDGYGYGDGYAITN